MLLEKRLILFVIIHFFFPSIPNSAKLFIGCLGIRSNGGAHLLRVCSFCVENADSVAGLKGRVKAARDKSKDLLKAVNGTMATLNALPNGKSGSIPLCT